MNKLKGKNGITLIALVITIIILLILAGISIVALGGENGLFSRAKQAKNNTVDAQNAENEALTGYEDRINEVTEGTEIPHNYPTLYSQVNVGDWVNYDAGDWSDKASSIIASGLPTRQGKFSILTSTSKNESITPYSTIANTYSGGWRVLSKDASTETVTLVHAGTPTAYYHGTEQSASITNLNNFCSTYYGASSTRLMVSSARSVNRTDYDSGNLNSTTGLLTTGSLYWLATANGSNYLDCVNDSGMVSFYNYGDSNYSYGVRPVVSLKSGVQTTGKTTNVYNTSEQGWDLTYSE